MLIFSHPACLDHDPGATHAESPQRLRTVLETLHAMDNGRFSWHEAPAADRVQLARVQRQSLITQILDETHEYPHRLDVDTVMSKGSAAAALHAAGAVVAAVDAVCSEIPDSSARQAFCAVRPPGHHATSDTAMGFCLFNGIAVGAAHAIAVHRLARVAIVDFDVHHGNGTQAIFEHDPRVLYLSSHQLPLYPDTGQADERGVGNICNAPLPAGADSKMFRQAWIERLFPELERFKPQLILVSAGFDAHRLDPLAGLILEFDDYRWIAQQLRSAAERHCGGRMISVLEGGYSMAALAGCTRSYIEGCLGTTD